MISSKPTSGPVWFLLGGRTTQMSDHVTKLTDSFPAGVRNYQNEALTVSSQEKTVNPHRS